MAIAVPLAEWSEPSRATLTVAQGAARFQLDDAEPIDIEHRPGLCRLLWALCERQLPAPGRPVSAHEVSALSGRGVVVPVSGVVIPTDWIRCVGGFMTIGSPIDKHIVLWP